MKQVILIILTIFLLPCDAYASTIEEDLSLLIENVKDLKKRTIDFDEKILNKVYPIGSIYESTNYSTVEEVQNIIGGKWERYGNGKTLIGVDESNSNFNVVNKIGGENTTTLSAENLPSHTHTIPGLSGTALSAGTHTHNNTAKSSTITGTFGTAVPAQHVKWASGAFSGITLSSSSSHGISIPNTTNPIYGYKLNATPTITMTNVSDGAHTHSVTTNEGTSGNTGSGAAFTNLPPYITVYRYKRIN